MQNLALNTVLYIGCCCQLTYTVRAGFQWDYVFDWTILKYQQTKNHAMGRPEAAPAAQADAADTDKGDRSGFARASRGDSGRRFVHQFICSMSECQVCILDVRM